MTFAKTFVLLVVCLLSSVCLRAQERQAELQTLHLSPHIKNIELICLTEDGTNIPCSIESCSIEFWDSKDILTECEVSANSKESLEHSMKEKNPYEIKTYEKDSTLVLEIRDTDGKIFSGGVELEFSAKYRMLVPKTIGVLNPELIKE